MDFIAHLLWSALIFFGPQLYLGIFFGVLPDLLPFGSNMIIGRFRNKGKSYKIPQDMFFYYQQPQNQWVYRFYNWTHSIVVWSFFFVITLLFELPRGSFPFYMFAWLLHILIDIPTHTKAFFAPQFLTPLSHFCVDGKSWAHPVFMISNYLLLIIVFLVRFEKNI